MGHYIAGCLAFPGCASKDVKAFRRAYEHFYRAALLAPKTPQLYYFALADAAGHLKDREAAHAIADCLVIRWRGSCDAWFYRGHVLGTLGEWPQAVEALEKSIALAADEPALGYFYFRLGRALDRSGETEQAIDAYRDSVHRKPDFARGHQQLGLALRKAGRLEEALPSLRQAVELDDGSATAWYHLANALRDTGQEDEAVAAYRRALRLERTLTEARIHLANILKKQGELTRAINLYRTATEHAPRDPVPHYNLGGALKQQGDLAGAAKAFGAAVELEGCPWHGHLLLGNVLLASKDEAGALDEYALCVAAKDEPSPNALGAPSPSEAVPPAKLACDLARRGDIEEAITAFRAALCADPELANVHCNLAGLLRRQGALIEALKHLRRGQMLGADRPDWPDGILRDLLLLETQVLREALRDALAGFADDGNASRRTKAARGLEEVLLGWRETLDNGDDDRPRIRGMLDRVWRDEKLRKLRSPEAIKALPKDERTAWRRVWALAEEVRSRLE